MVFDVLGEAMSERELRELVRRRNEAARRYAKAYVRGLRDQLDFMNGKDREVIGPILAAHTGVPLATLLCVAAHGNGGRRRLFRCTFLRTTGIPARSCRGTADRRDPPVDGAVSCRPTATRCLRTATTRPTSATSAREDRRSLDSDPMHIGVTVPLGQDDTAEGRSPTFAETLAFAQHAEAIGLDSVWVFDHLLFRSPGEPDEGIREAWTTKTALAALVPRVELGSLVMCASFRSPTLMAKMAATLDDLSGGRVILGLGAGWHEPEFRAFGYPYDHLISRFEEAMAIIHPLLRDGAVDFAGEYYSARECELRPRGPRPQGPPIMIGAGVAAGFTARWVAEVPGITEARAGTYVFFDLMHLGAGTATEDQLALLAGEVDARPASPQCQRRENGGDRDADARPDVSPFVRVRARRQPGAVDRPVPGARPAVRPAVRGDHRAGPPGPRSGI